MCFEQKRTTLCSDGKTEADQTQSTLFDSCRLASIMQIQHVQTPGGGTFPGPQHERSLTIISWARARSPRGFHGVDRGRKFSCGVSTCQHVMWATGPKNIPLGSENPTKLQSLIQNMNLSIQTQRIMLCPATATV